MRDIDHFIGGQSVAGTSGRFADVFDPNTGRVQARVQLASTAEVDAAMRASGHFGPRVEVPDDADPTTQVLAFYGRS